jgi:hypothetical protein
LLNAQGLLNGAHHGLEVGDILVGEGQQQDEKTQKQRHHVGEGRHPRRNPFFRLGRIGFRPTASLFFNNIFSCHETPYHASLWGMWR